MNQADNVVLLKDWLSIGAMIVGPILAVLATRVVDYYREKSVRKNAIFKTLMMTRMNKLSYDHIGALNAIEIEFHDRKEVLNSWKSYLENLSTDMTSMSEGVQKSHFAKRERLFASLVSQIAKVLKLKIEQLDILNENYFPQGWFDVERDQREIRQSMIQLFRGHIALPVHIDKSPILEKYFDTMRKKAEEKAKDGAAS